MDKQTISITERDGTYHIQNNGISEFALIGILECIVFDLKTANGQKPQAAQIEEEKPAVEQSDQPEVFEKKEAARTPEKTRENSGREAAQPSNSTDLRTRISNAVKAIKNLGGEADEKDLGSATDEELRFELEELTNQYKRLKNSKNSVTKK